MKENNRELQYFKIEHAYGGNQERFSDYMMKICLIIRTEKSA